MPAAIPIENIYYLFCYAWDRFPEGKAIGVGTVVSPTIWDLLASVLDRGIRRLLRVGLDRDYSEREGEVVTVRGRILVDETAWRMAAHRAQAYCRFDEFQHDVVQNQIIKATIQSLVRQSALDGAVRHVLLSTLRSLPPISDVRLSSAAFSRLQANSQ